MGRRAIHGPYGRAIPQSEHGIPDDKLLTGGQYGTHRGVSRQRVMSNFKQGLINRYVDSRGRPTYHATTCDQQWQEVSEPSTVSVPTQGQRARGLSGPDVMETAGDFSPQPAPDIDKTDDEADAAAQPAPKKKEAKTDLVYGQARTKGMIHKAQLDELKVLQQREILVNRRGLSGPIVAAATMTRDRVMIVPEFVAIDLYEIARDHDDQRAGVHAVRQALTAALADALVSISDDGIKGLL